MLIWSFCTGIHVFIKMWKYHLEIQQHNFSRFHYFPIFITFCISKTNERWCRIFGKLSLHSPPPMCLSGGKNDITFFSIGPIWPKKNLVRQKYSLCWFSNIFFEFVCFPRFYPIFAQNRAFFCLKSRILVGNRQSQKKKFKWKVWTQEMSLDTSSATKTPKVMILCFSKVRPWSRKIWKNENSSDFFTFSLWTS